MPRPKSRTTKPDLPQSNDFVDALKFVSAVTKEDGSPNETHVHLQNGWVTAFNGILAAGHKIKEDIFAAPNNQLMIEALSKCNEHLSITQLDNNRLSIKSDKFKAIVPCIDPIVISVAIPDAPLASINDNFKIAIDAVGVLADDNSEKIYSKSILMQSGSVVATNNGKILFEAWHGIDMPVMAIPKSIVQAIVKCPKKLFKFGFSHNSFTFHFEDESWLRTQLFADKWPDLKHILDQKSNPWPLPADFFKALDAVAPFSIDDTIYFQKNLMCSHNIEGTGATYEVQGLPAGLIFSLKQLYQIKPHVKTIDFFAQGPNGPLTLFFGDNVRGAIAGRKQ